MGLKAGSLGAATTAKTPPQICSRALSTSLSATVQTTCLSTIRSLSQGGNPGPYPGRQAAGMFSSMFQGQNASSFGAVRRKAYVASLKRISPKGKSVVWGTPVWPATGLLLANAHCCTLEIAASQGAPWLVSKPTHIAHTHIHTLARRSDCYILLRRALHAA